MNVLVSFLKMEDGQGMVEYLFILMLVALVAIGGFTVLGNNLSNKINEVANGGL